MHLTSKFNKRICFLLCASDIFIKYAWAIPLKDKRGDINGEEIVGTFYEKELQKTNKTGFRVKK